MLTPRPPNGEERPTRRNRPTLTLPNGSLTRNPTRRSAPAEI
nr:hypothetical protein JVH1_3898 [Rhodococcus sp. JVH1]